MEHYQHHPGEGRGPVGKAAVIQRDRPAQPCFPAKAGTQTGLPPLEAVAAPIAPPSCRNPNNTCPTFQTHGKAPDTPKLTPSRRTFYRTRPFQT